MENFKLHTYNLQYKWIIIDIMNEKVCKAIGNKSQNQFIWNWKEMLDCMLTLP